MPAGRQPARSKPNIVMSSLKTRASLANLSCTAIYTQDAAQFEAARHSEAKAGERENGRELARLTGLHDHTAVSTKTLFRDDQAVDDA